jgi:hypothetical protein
MAGTPSVKELNEELARRINQEALREPQSPYRGKYIGLANGQVIVVADGWGPVLRALERAEPDPQKRFCLYGGEDENEEYEIWGPV